MKNPFRIELPFYQPCSVLMLDDDDDFLLSMRDSLASEFAVCCYNSCHSALEKINTSEKIAVEGLFPFIDTGLADGTPGADQTEALETPIADEIPKNSGRYEMVSVAIIDEVMPTMSGLEVCKKLQNSGVKTIMLTGQMNDPQATIEAFNEGIIDRFISKGDSDAFAKIKRSIRELQEQYFREKYGVHSSAAMGLKSHKVTSDTMSLLMQAAFEEYPFSEYYYHAKSGGYYLRCDQGSGKYCLFTHQNTLDDVSKFLENQPNCSKIVDKLKAGKHLLLWECLDDDLADDIVTLEKSVFPARVTDEIAWCLVDESEMPHCLSSGQTNHAPSWHEYKQKILQSPINGLEAG